MTHTHTHICIERERREKSEEREREHTHVYLMICVHTRIRILFSETGASGSSSRVPDIHEPDLACFPRFARTDASRVTCLLRPGDAVFIPPLWFHHVGE